MEEKVLEKKLENKKSPKRRKVKSWGDEGFVGKIQYGAFDYSVEFVPEKKIKEIIGDEGDNNVYGAINQFQQVIYIASDTTMQCKKATMLHELVHAIFLMNGSMYIGDNKEDVDEQMNVASELLVDRTANGMFEIIRRNPEVMKWLQR